MNFSKNEIKDIFLWDVKNWSKSLTVWKLSAVKTGSAIAFGEREGGASLFLAKLGYEVRCTDIRSFSKVPLETHEKHKVAQKIRYEEQDITSIQHPDNSFDVVAFKSVVGALGSKEKQQKAMDEVHRILKPGGQLIFAENQDASFLHRFARKKFTAWGKNWRYLNWKETDELLQKFDSYQKDAHGFFAAFGRTEKQRRFLGKIDEVICKMIPKSARYIQIVKAEK